MLKYPCLILDHDDTVVQSESTINYPYFCYILDQFRPGQTITREEYKNGCFYLGFAEMCRKKYNFTEQELVDEYLGWKEFIRSHTPDPYPGVKEVIHKQKEAGGKIFVVSHSSAENITRDYEAHFGIQPDGIYGWDLPEHQRKPSTYPLLHIMEHYGFTREQMIVIDDMRPAYEMCHNAQVPIGFAAWSHNEFPTLCQQMEALCDYTFHSPDELYNFLF